jgi:hypothetical protein
MQRDDRTNHDANERADWAFSVYCGDGNQNMRAVSRITSIPYRTIQYYARTRNWPERYLAQMTPEAERGALIARNRMRMRLPQLEEELWEIISGKAPLRTREGTLITDQDGTPILAYAAPPRDRVYAAKLYLEYSLARLLPEDQLAIATSTPMPRFYDGMSPSEKAAAIIEAHVHDASRDERKRRR